jgi:hypothetical protein
MKRSLLLFAAGALVAFATLPASAQVCTCDTLPTGICSAQGFEITLVSHEVDGDAGVSTWDYQVCNDAGVPGDCVPPKDLSHIDIDLPGLGSCLSLSQSMSLVQTGGFASAALSCGISEKDPSCDLFGTKGTDFVAKCDVATGNLDAGECVTMRLSIAGETPVLGRGVATTVTKAGPDCLADCIAGPSCSPCEQPPEDACLTRTPGFWGTHPHITNLYLPQTVCGQSIDTVLAGSCSSATEAMCVAPGKESKGNPQYAQLVRQLMAAKLNLAATAAAGGTCDAGFSALVGQCEALCASDGATIDASGCIEGLAAFNESVDTFGSTPAPFDRPGPANPRECQKANGNKVLIGSSCH